MSAMPAHADALAFFPWRDVVADRIDAPGDFVTRHTRILNSGPETFFDQHVAMANAARLHFHAHLSGPGSGMSRSTNSKSPPGLPICATVIFELID